MFGGTTPSPGVLPDRAELSTPGAVPPYHIELALPRSLTRIAIPVAAGSSPRPLSSLRDLRVRSSPQWSPTRDEPCSRSIGNVTTTEILLRVMHRVPRVDTSHLIVVVTTLIELPVEARKLLLLSDRSGVSGDVPARRLQAGPAPVPRVGQISSSGLVACTPPVRDALHLVKSRVRACAVKPAVDLSVELSSVVC